MSSTSRPAMESTCSDMIVQTVHEAHILMYAVLSGLRPLIHRRPCNEDERSVIRSGAVFVWEEGVSYTPSSWLPI
jgi:hypothetical protein